METPDLTLILEFQHRLRKLADTSGYAFVYDALALIREYIPCREIGIDIIKPASEDHDQFVPGCDELWISSQWTGYLEQIFMAMMKSGQIPYVDHCAQDVMERLAKGEPTVPHSFARYGQGQASLVDRFYSKIFGASDIADMSGLLGRYQFVESPRTRSFYTIFAKF